ncbi:hypothetical protein [Pedobacter caeni]|uniref:Uncharacterized protein n=1 Tax=Pedobacter caeni TaxID=288992 RepID=A0A1M5KWX7_9SPHI|nr:hypothetical protein [Pedobacter caeni]SHG57247.1 hypothetical protein SAMN04488522_106123 [Pedobacter caeni]
MQTELGNVYFYNSIKQTVEEKISIKNSKAGYVFERLKEINGKKEMQQLYVS